MPKKFYVVWVGKKKGIFETWDECKQSIQGVSGAKFKSFSSKIRAQAEYYGETCSPNPGEMALTVDGACKGSTGEGEFRGVLLPSKTEVFRYGPYSGATNNIMEYLAAIRGLKWIESRGLRIPVYTDSATALHWIKDSPQSECATSASVPSDSVLFSNISKSKAWINSRVKKAELLGCLRKWDTAVYGEIPADFGRK